MSWRSPAVCITGTVLQYQWCHEGGEQSCVVKVFSMSQANLFLLLIIILIIKVFVKRKILSIETILNTHTQTHTHTHTHTRTHTHAHTHTHIPWLASRQYPDLGSYVQHVARSPRKRTGGTPAPGNPRSKCWSPPPHGLSSTSLPPCLRAPPSRGVTADAAAVSLVWDGSGPDIPGSTAPSIACNTTRPFPCRPRRRTFRTSSPPLLLPQTREGRSQRAWTGQGWWERSWKGQGSCSWRWWCSAVPGSGRQCFPVPSFVATSPCDALTGCADCDKTGTPDLSVRKRDSAFQLHSLFVNCHDQKNSNRLSKTHTQNHTHTHTQTLACAACTSNQNGTLESKNLTWVGRTSLSLVLSNMVTARQILLIFNLSYLPCSVQFVNKNCHAKNDLFTTCWC